MSKFEIFIIIVLVIKIYLLLLIYFSLSEIHLQLSEVKEYIRLIKKEMFKKKNILNEDVK